MKKRRSLIILTEALAWNKIVISRKVDMNFR